MADRAEAVARPPVAPDSPEDRAREFVEGRDAAVLTEVAREGDATVAFQGLRRKLGLHQEVLTRSLRRLERAGLVAHDERGYRATERGLGAVAAVAPAVASARPALALVTAVLPPDVTAEDVGGHLARRWFRGLRWYGESEAPGETVLTWLVEGTNAPVRVRVAGSAVTVETEGAARERATYAAARAVLGALAELYGMDASVDSAGVQAMLGADTAAA